ncbi:Von Willebrand factor A [Sparganum proliferum]
MGLLGHMGIHDSGIHRSLDTPSTYRTPTMDCPIHTPSFSTPITGRPTITAAAAATTTTTTTTTETDADVPDLSCQHCPHTFTSRIVPVGHWRIHRTETGEPVPGAPTPTHPPNTPQLPSPSSHGSRNVFGVTKGDRIGLLIDVSDRFLKSGRQSHLRACLREYIDEQWTALSTKWSTSVEGAKEAIYIATYGTEVVPLWDDPVPPSWRSLAEAKQFFNCQLKPSGGSNLLAGLKHMLRISREKHLSTVVVVVGGPPDQDGDLLIEFLEQSLAVTVEDVGFDFVCFGCNSSGMQQLLARLAAVNQYSSFHCYSPVKDGTAFISDDIAVLIKELETARSLLEHVKSKRLFLEAEEAAKKRTPGADKDAEEWGELDRPLNLSDCKLTPKKTFLPETSKILAQNAYPQQSEYVQAIGKQVFAQVYEKAMIQVNWPDGTVRNVHVDVPKLEEYQRKLTVEMTLFEQRISWLGRNSRGTFGTLVERYIILLLDFSEFSRPFLEKMLRYLRQLLQEQIAVHVEWFNLIAICESVEIFRPDCVPVTANSLQEAWVWLLDRVAGGTRNFLAGFRHVFEEMKDQRQPMGLYLFATGVADQEDGPLEAYVSSALVAREGCLHCVLFSPEAAESKRNQPVQAGRFANPQETAKSLRFLSNETGGRFHWFSESGVIESDDVQQLMDEITRAVHFSLTGKQLVDQFRMKYAKPKVMSSCEKSSCLTDKTNLISVADHIKLDPRRLEFPPATSLSEARRLFLRRKQQEAKNTPKSLTRRQRRTYSMQVRRSHPGLSESFFFSEEANKVEIVLGRTNKTSGAPNCIQKESIPASEELEPTPAFTQQTLSNYLDDFDLVLFNRVRNHSGETLPVHSRLKTYFTTKINSRVSESPNAEPRIGGGYLHIQNHQRNFKPLRCRARSGFQSTASGRSAHRTEVIRPGNMKVSARYCAGLFPLIQVRGKTRHFQLTTEQCNSFELQVRNLLKRYKKRLLWLLSSPRVYLGVLLEDCIVFVLDISGSMNSALEDLKEKLERIIWEDICKQRKLFNILVFGSKVVAWRSAGPIFADADACHDAISWLRQLCASDEAENPVCLGAAMAAALEQTELAATSAGPHGQNRGQSLKVGIYLVTDGAPGKFCSQTLAEFFDSRNRLLRFVQDYAPAGKKDQQEEDVPCLRSLPRVHTITIGKRNVATESLLRALAHHCEGRFLSTVETQLPINEYLEARDRQLLGESAEFDLGRASNTELPPLQSDDLLLLVKEVNKCYSMLREMISDTVTLDSTEVLSVHALLRQMQLQQRGHVKRMNDEYLPKRLFCDNITVNACRQGGRKCRYEDTLIPSLEHLQIDSESWEVLAPD